MVVVCKNCETRFNLPDEKIPPGGAKVRCSRCEHAFHVDPPGPLEARPSPGRPEDTDTGRPEEPAPFREDSDLEHPEFLFGVDEDDEAAGKSEEGVLGGAASDDFDLGEIDEPPPELGTIDADLSPPDDGLQLVSEVEAREQESEDSEPGDSWDPFDDGLATPPPLRAREPIPVRSGQGFAEQEFERADASEGEEKAAPAARAKRRGPGRLAPLLATVVGVFLIVGGLRALKLYAIDHEPGPPSVRTTGWIATDIHAMYVRDASGRRVLVVRGNLASDGSTRTPKVWATLLDADGEALGSSVSGLMTRLEVAELGPEALKRRFDSPARSRIIGRIKGFTVLIPDPSEEARRYRVELTL